MVLKILKIMETTAIFKMKRIMTPFHREKKYVNRPMILLHSSEYKKWFVSILQSTKMIILHSSEYKRSFEDDQLFPTHSRSWGKSVLLQCHKVRRFLRQSHERQRCLKWRWLSNYSLMLISSGWTHHKTFSMPVLRAHSSETNTNSEIASSSR